jgi:hypothetical protein
MNVTIDTPAEYALYWLVLNRPDVIAEAERSRGIGMLANDQDAARRVKALFT